MKIFSITKALLVGLVCNVHFIHAENACHLLAQTQGAACQVAVVALWADKYCKNYPNFASTQCRKFTTDLMSKNTEGDPRTILSKFSGNESSLQEIADNSHYLFVEWDQTILKPFNVKLRLKPTRPHHN